MAYFTSATATDVGELLRRARGKSKQEAIAQAAGCTTSYINRLEKGKTLPSPRMAVKLERLLRLKPGELVQRVVAVKLQTRSARVLQEFQDSGVEVLAAPPAVATQTDDPLRAILERFGYTSDDLAPLNEEDWETIRTVLDPLIKQLLERKAKLGRRSDHPPKAKSVFIVEDEIKICHVLASALRDRGFAVDYAFNGQSALRRLLRNGHTPDLILVDLRMPHMGGFEFLRKLRKVNMSSKVIVVTGHPEDIVELQVHATDLKLEGYFEKPFHLQELLAKAEELLA